MRAASFILTLCLLAPAASAQVVGKIPPAPAPTPEYTPPAPPPPTPPAPPVEPDPVAPSLIERDPAGKLILLTTHVEDRAVAAYPFKPAAREKVDASIAARNADLERWAADHLDQIQTALAVRSELNQVTDFNQLVRAKDAVAPLKQEPLLDRLQRDGAITPGQRSQLEKTIAEYTDARKAEWEKQTGADIMKIATFTGQQGFADNAHASLAAFDRLVARAAADLRASSHGLELKPDQSRALAAALAAPAPTSSDQPSPIREFILTSLSPEQRTTLLRKQLPPTSK